MLHFEQMNEQEFWQQHCQPAILDTPKHTKNRTDANVEQNGFSEYLARHFDTDTMSPFAIRHIPTMHRDTERWAVAGRRVHFAMETQSDLCAAISVDYKPAFGNSFIYFMEHFCRLITDNIETVMHNTHSLGTQKQELANLSPFARDYRMHYDRLVSKISHLTSVMSKQETLLGRRLATLSTWAEAAEVTHDSKAFFEAYTLGYFGEPLSLEGLHWWFASEKENHTQK